MNTGTSTIICSFSLEYEQLTQYLPTQEKEILDQYKIDKKVLQTYQQAFLDLTKHNFWNLGIERVSRLSLAMLKESMLSIQQVSSLHICIEAIEKFIIKHKAYLEFLNIPESYSTSCFSRISYDFQPDLNKDKKNKQTYFYAYYVQEFFDLNKVEWKKFCHLMQKEDPIEHLGYLFPLPKFIYGSLNHKTFSNKKDEEKIFVPSFSMLQHSLAVKRQLTHEHRQLVPFFGHCSVQDSIRLNLERKIPFSLYYPSSLSEKKLTQACQEKQTIEPIIREFLNEQFFHVHYSLNSFNLFRSIINETQAKINTKYDEMVEGLTVDELTYDQDNYKVKISNCTIATLRCFSAVIVNCKIEKIVALSSLYIQGSSVNSIKANKIVFIRDCEKTSIKAEKIIFEMNTVSGKKKADTIIALSPKQYINDICEYKVESGVKCATFIPSFNTEALYLSKGSCISKIVFIEDSGTNEVFIEEGCVFKGEVEKGHIINLDDSSILTHIA